MTKLPEARWTVTHNSWETSTVYDAKGEIVCECPISNDVTEETQEHYEAINEAKAEAIVALPELIKAVTSFIGEIEDTPSVASKVIADLSSFRALRSALSKAGVE